MKLEDVGTAVVKRLWVVVVIVLVAALVAAVVARVQDPVYRAEIVLAATPPKNPTTKLPDPTVGLAYTAAMSSIANACESVGVAETVSKRLGELGLAIPPDELVKKASAIPIANSTSLKMTFSDSSPTRVAEIANAWGEILELKTLVPSGELENPYYDADFKELLMGGTLVFTNRAVPPTKPVRPKPLVYLGLGVFLGLVLGLGLAISWEYFDPHFRSVAETEEILGLPVLGNIPRLKEAPDPLAALKPGTPAWTALADLRSNLLLSLREGGRRSLALVPVIPYEEGPRHAAILARGVANTGRSVLLVDADLMEGSLTRELNARGRQGLSEVLERGGNPLEVAFPLEKAGYHFIPSGKTNPRSTDLLSLPRWEDWVREMEQGYDLVIFYAPPLLLASDAAVIASWTGSSFLLIDSEHCTRKVAMEALAPLQRLEIKPSGTILANVKVKGWRKFRMPAEEVHAPGKGREEGPTRERRLPEKGVEERPAEGKGAVAASLAGPDQGERSGEPPATGPRPTSARTSPRAAPGKEAIVPSGPGTEQAARIPAGRADVAVSAGEAPAGGTPGALPLDDREELARIRQAAVESFRKLGRSGDSIPKSWIRALRSPREEVRATAEEAIGAYYQVFLERYGIGGEAIARITATIIRMMRREGEFAHITEEEAQAHLRKLLLEAGANLGGGERGEKVSARETAPPSPGAGVARPEPAGASPEAGQGSGPENIRYGRQASASPTPPREAAGGGILSRLRKRNKG